MANAIISGTLSIALTLAGSATWAAGGWGPADAFPRERSRTVQGCASMATDDTYTCLFVRCDRKDIVGLYAAAPGPDITGRVIFEVDGRPFQLTFAQLPQSPIPLANKAEALPSELLSALKTGKVVRIVGAKLASGYDRVSLAGAGPAISRVEAACSKMK